MLFKVRYDVLYIHFSKICVDNSSTYDIIKLQEHLFLWFVLLSLRGEDDGREISQNFQR